MINICLDLREQLTGYAFELERLREENKTMSEYKDMVRKTTVRCV